MNLNQSTHNRIIVYNHMHACHHSNCHIYSYVRNYYIQYQYNTPSLFSRLVSLGSHFSFSSTLSLNRISGFSWSYLRCINWSLIYVDDIYSFDTYQWEF